MNVDILYSLHVYEINMFAILSKVHRAYEQTGNAGARIFVGPDHSVYNAHCTQTNVSDGTNRFYVIQLLTRGGRFEIFTVQCSPEKRSIHQFFIAFRKNRAGI